MLVSQSIDTYYSETPRAPGPLRCYDDLQLEHSPIESGSLDARPAQEGSKETQYRIVSCDSASVSRSA